MTLLARLILLAAAFAVATFAFGWWSVPVIGAAFAAMTTSQRGTVIVSALGAMLGWGALLAITATQGPVGTLATELGGILQVSPLAVYAATIAFPGLLAATAAVIGRAVAIAASRR